MKLDLDSLDGEARAILNEATAIAAKHVATATRMARRFEHIDEDWVTAARAALARASASSNPTPEEAAAVAIVGASITIVHNVLVGAQFRAESPTRGKLRVIK